MINHYQTRIKHFFHLFRQAYGSYRRAIITLIILGFAGGFLEGIGVNALIPLLSFFINGESGGEDFISRSLEQVFTFFRVDFDLLSLLIFVSVMFLLKALVTFLFSYLKIKIRSDYEFMIRADLFKKTFKSRWPNLVKQKIGYLETVLVTDVRGGAELLETISGSVMAVTNLLVYLAIAINISFSFTAITLVIGGLMFLVIKSILYKIRRVNQNTAQLNKGVSHFVNEHIIGLRTVKIMRQEETITRLARLIFERLKNYQIQSFQLRSLITAMMQPISVVYISIVIGIIYYSGNPIDIGALAALVYLINRIFSYIQSLQSNLSQINTSFPYLEAVLNYSQKAQAEQESDTGTQTFRFNHQLRLRNLGFAYNTDPVLTDLNLTVKRGEMIGLIGPSGSGKTTLFDLILRMLQPTAGSITIDDTKIQDINLDAWRENIGYVSQEIFLLNDTILSNIKFYDDAVSDEMAIEAAKAANIHDFIIGLPEGYQTVVGERGTRLSIGQRQRITIARVLVRKPHILLFDEATSALDNESELAIQRAIEKLKGETTILVIAHRLTTVRNCDKLLILNSGKIVEQGQPDELLKNHDSRFYKLYNIH